MNTLLFSILALTPFVAGHGYLDSITIDGRTYQGNTPGSSSISSPIRSVGDISPVKGANNLDLACGLNAQKAVLVADAQPGSTVSLKWVNPVRGNWIHEVGPLITYMASCGSVGCSSFNHANAKWFKIQQSGLRSDGTWAMHDLYDGTPAQITLPSNLAPGQYLLRHEIIALHTAQSLGGAEFYPACAQLRVGGSKTGKPASTVSIPGMYSDDDAGILVDPYTMSGSYQFPGPAVSNLAGSTVKLVVNGTTSIPTSTSEAESATSSGYKLLIFPRRVSRIMRSLNFA